MTTSAIPYLESPPVRTGRGRLVIGYLAVLAMTPYIALKAAWVSGSTVGLSGIEHDQASVLMGFNLLTLVLDLVAVLVVLAFTHRWGLRLPAWSVLLPTWVGTGLLAPIVIVFPVTTAIGLWSGGAGAMDFLDPWVRPMVYTSFVAQGAGIAAAFALYSRDRWRPLFTALRGSAPPSEFRPVYTFGVGLTAALVVPSAGLELLWGAGFDLGLPEELAGARSASTSVTLTTFGVLTVAGLVGLGALWRAQPGTRLWPALVATWVGSGVTWAWAAWPMLILLAQTSGGAELPGTGLVHWVDFAQVLAGTIAAVVGLLLTLEVQRDLRAQPTSRR